MDDKAFEGACLMAELWPGPVRCVFRTTDASAVLFGRARNRASLPFEAILIPQGEMVPLHLLADASIVVASGDNWLDLDVSSRCRRHGVPVIYVAENILLTRLQILALEAWSWPRKLKSLAWNLATEVRRRRAFTTAVALACNGAPAAMAYSGGPAEVLTFFDTRMQKEMFASDEELLRKADWLRGGKPLRLAFSGRLEPLKGADHLLLVARELERLHVEFSLDVFGTGSLAGQMERDVAKWRLGDSVTLHGAVEFRDHLVPFFRTQVDAFVCCHRQSDPSCTYLEAMGCGVPVIGYRNKALEGILDLAQAGQSVTAHPRSLAKALARAASDREWLIKTARSARDFSAANDFVSTFKRRIEQCLRWSATAPAAAS